MRGYIKKRRKFEEAAIHRQTREGKKKEIINPRTKDNETKEPYSKNQMSQAQIEDLPQN